MPQMNGTDAMVRIAKSELDIKFRRVVAARLASAKTEVLVVTGEFSAFSNYIELQWAVRDAAIRGVRFRIYSNSFLPGVARKLMRWGCRLYTGARRADDHFMIVDGREVVVSEAHPPGSCGDRRGLVTGKGIAGYEAIFHNLSRTGRRVRRVSGPDPLETWLAKNAWTDAPVDTSRMDGDMGQV